MKKLLVKHYAKALLAASDSQGVFEQLQQDLQTVDEKLSENLELKTYLLDPHVTLNDKKKALQAVFQDFISAKTYNFVLLLIKKKKLAYLTQILISSQKLYQKKSLFQEVVVESVVALDAKQEKQIVQFFEEKLKSKIVVNNIINNNLIGGLKINIDNDVIDLSLAGKMNRLRQQIQNIK